VEYEFQSKSIRKTMTVRNWKNYSKEKWLAQLKTVDWEITQESVQDISNHLEIKILEALQAVAPVEEQLLKKNLLLNATISNQDEKETKKSLQECTAKKISTRP
jgi:hypothetical protein